MRTWLLVTALVVVSINAWDPYGLGDSFRDGKLRIMFYLLAPFLAWVWSKRIPMWILGIWVWNVWLWSYFGPDDYGWEEIVLPPFFLLSARYLVHLQPYAVMNAIRVSYFLQAALAIVQFSGYAPAWAQPVVNEANGTFGHFTLLGCFIAPLVPLALFKWSWPEAMLGVIAVALTGSTMAAAALGASLVMMLWKVVGPRLALSTAGLLGGVVAVLWWHQPDSQVLSASGRLTVWGLAWDRIQERPLGWGPGSWLGLYPHWNIPGVFPRMQWEQLHSDWLQLQFTGGWPSTVLAGLGVSMTLWTTKNPIKASVLAGLAVAAAGNFVFRFPATALLACLVLFLPEPHEA